MHCLETIIYRNAKAQERDVRRAISDGVRNAAFAPRAETDFPATHRGRTLAEQGSKAGAEQAISEARVNAEGRRARD